MQQLAENCLILQRNTGWPRADRDFLTHENIKKGMTWNAPVLCTKQTVFYLFVTFGRSTPSRWASFTWNALSSRRFTKLSKTRCNSVWLWSQFRLLCYVSAITVYAISSVPIGRNVGPSVPAAVHENAVRRSLTRYIQHWSIVSGQILKWSDIAFSPGDGDVPSRGCWWLTGHPLHSPDDLTDIHLCRHWVVHSSHNSWNRGVL
jgi:hypothetical protein